MRASLVGLLFASASSLAEANVPKACAVGVTMKSRAARGTTTGTLTRFDKRDADPAFIEATIDDGKGKVVELTLYLPPGLRAAAPALAALAQGATVTMAYQCGGGWHLVCDARIEDAHGQVLVIASGTGSDALAGGWTATVGKIVSARQDPNTTNQSVQRSHEVELAHGKALARVHEGTCTQVVDGKQTYLASGSATTWLGQRPPEGFDWKAYSLVLQSVGP
jgi:hypothetical protein